MAERKIQMSLPDGKTVDGVEVGVRESTERWSDFELEDGTKFRIKVTVLGVNRASKDYDPGGLPWYQFNVLPVFSTMEVPDHLKKNEKK